MTDADTICAIAGCNNRYGARGLCPKHYERAKRQGVLPPLKERTYIKKGQTCKVTDCVNPVDGRGICRTHADRLARHWPDWDTRPVRALERSGYGKDRHWEYKLRRNYGMEKGEYLRMLEAQDGLCAMCGGTNSSGKRLAVDHDHKTGKVRGLLCTNCNSALGKFGEDIDRLLEAALYLIMHQAQEEPSV